MNTNIASLEANTLRVLQVSTCHIKQRTATELGQQSRAPLWNSLTYTHWGDYGWILYTSEDQISAARQAGVPDLAVLLQFTLDRGFGYLWIDRDADPLPEAAGMPTFEW